MTINFDQYTNTLNVTDTATNADLNFTTKGTGVVNLNTGNGTAFRVSDLGGTIVGGLAVYAGSSAQNTVYVAPYGSGAGVNFVLASKGTSPVIFGTNTSNNATSTEQLRVAHTASAVNFVQVTGAATGGAAPIISSQGSDSNITLGLQSKGNASVALLTNTRVQFDVFGGGSVVNYIRAAGANTGFSPALQVLGSDTNIDLTLTPKGTGVVQFGIYTANMALTIQGYLEIKDSGGTVRRLAVIA